MWSSINFCFFIYGHWGTLRRLLKASSMSNRWGSWVSNLKFLNSTKVDIVRKRGSCTLTGNLSSGTLNIIFWKKSLRLQKCLNGNAKISSIDTTWDSFKVCGRNHISADTYLVCFSYLNWSLLFISKS